MGRRRSVAGATSWRCPSARTRPGAGLLPTLALGRPRGPPNPRAARDAAVPTPAPLMTPLRRPSRQVYRVYSEAEFLAAADWSGEATAEGSSSSPWGRAVGIAALAGAVAIVAGVVVVSASRSSVSRRSTLGLLADSRSPRSAPSSAPVALPASSQPLGRDRRRHGRAPRGPAGPRRTARRDGVRELGQTRTPAVAAPPTAAMPPSPTPPAAPDPTPTSSPATSPAAPPPATTPPTTASANAARSEFGFERQTG